MNASSPTGEPIPFEARAILRTIAAELRQTPRSTLATAAEVAQLIARTADRIEGVAAISRPRPTPRAWRSQAAATSPTGPGHASVNVVDGREIAVETRRRVRRPAPD